MAEYHIRWDPTNKKWEVSVDAGAFADLVENPTIEQIIGNAIAAPGGIASKGILWFDSTANRFKFKENNGAADAWCRESGYPATGLDINGLTEDTAPDTIADFLITHDVVAGLRKKVRPSKLPTIAARAYHNANITVNTGSAVLIPFNSESYDTNGLHDNATNNSRLTIPTGGAGYYRVTGRVRWASGTAGTNRQLFLERNAAGTDTAGNRFADLTTHVGMVAIMNMEISEDIYLSDGDHVELFAASSENTTINTVTTFYYPHPSLSIHRIGA